MPYANKDKRLAYHKTHRSEWREAGLCTRCGGLRTDSRLKCEECALEDNAKTAAIAKGHVLAGKCKCGKPRIDKKFLCQSCRDYSAQVLRNLKIQVLEGYGGRCVCCGANEREFLSIDHAAERGCDERRRLGENMRSGSLYRKIIREGFPDSYQILCYNCNMSLGFFGYCPHHPENRRAIDKAVKRK